MFKTPYYKINDENVYTPSEDTFLLLDALELEFEEILKLQPKIVMEIGSGSGIASVFLQQILLTNDNKNLVISYCIDINKNALNCTKNSFELNNLNNKTVEYVNCNLIDPLFLKLNSAIDVLIFNPPYVPSEKPAKDEKDFYYAGGENGRYFIDCLLPKVSHILSKTGVFYMICIQENNIDSIIQYAAKNNLKTKVVLERKCGIEHLFALKFWQT